jgi:hypothetical protein
MIPSFALTSHDLEFTICSKMSSEIAAVLEPDFSDAQAWDAAGEGCALPSAERRLRMLDRLAVVGLEISLAIERRVKDAPPDQPLAELNAAAMAYARAARAVRMAVLLQSRLAEGPVADEAANDAKGPQKIIFGWEECPDERDERAQARRERLGQIVEHIAEKERGDAEAAERLGREAAERLERDDIYGDVLERPVSEVVADICRDLGLEPDWDGLFARPWARHEIADGDIGAPLAAVMARMRAVSPVGGQGP